MTTLQVNPVNFVTSINHNDPREKLFSEEITEELRAILKVLKKGLQGYSGWIQTYAIRNESKPAFFDASAVELNQVSAHFTDGFSKLSNYLQQFPHPADFGVAQDIEKKIERLLSNDLAKETLTQTSTTVTSWGEMIHPSAGTNWSPELIQQFTQDVSQVSWKKAKQLIDQLESL